jgi:hypothetical protein
VGVDVQKSSFSVKADKVKGQKFWNLFELFRMNYSLCYPLLLKPEWGDLAVQGRLVAKQPGGEAARLLLVVQLEPVLEGVVAALLCSAAAAGSR